jgi:hypothetical protein
MPGGSFEVSGAKRHLWVSRQEKGRGLRGEEGEQAGMGRKRGGGEKE